MQPPIITTHARQRLQQRGSRFRELVIVIAHGDIEIPARNGCRYIQLSNREASRLCRDEQLNVSDVDRAQRIIALLDQEGRVVTILKGNRTGRASAIRPGGRR